MVPPLNTTSTKPLIMNIKSTKDLGHTQVCVYLSFNSSGCGFLCHLDSGPTFGGFVYHVVIRVFSPCVWLVRAVLGWHVVGNGRGSQGAGCRKDGWEKGLFFFYLIIVLQLKMAFPHIWMMYFDWSVQSWTQLTFGQQWELVWGLPQQRHEAACTQIIFTQHAP